jgi:beta-hydroxylase
VTSIAEKQSQTAPDQAAAQHFGTEGIKPLARASRITRIFMRVVAFVERLNLSHS